MINFNNVETPTNTEYLKPGMYNVKVTDVQLVQNEGKTPYLEVHFTSKMGTLKEKFFLKGKDEEKTNKILERLQYLHNSWFGKPLQKEFDSYETVQKYFHKALTTYPKEHAIVVGGTQQPNGTVYSNLGFQNFVLPDLVDEVVFEPGSPQYTMNIRMNSYTGAVNATDNAMIPSGNSSSNFSDDEELPF